ncbi:MAG TPA: TIGR03960 family B12-binding radical SAM protein [Candidatus Acidoferrum sp.]|nr:TIGR03960 family B12-binding radical SAM protein [Candidatus Acidoferrum sp.]
MHDEILRRVQKPSYYTGGEYGSVTKELRPGLLRYAFCFPDTYDIGMSYLGGKILYGLLNSIPDVWCERVFAPAEDMENEMRAANLPLFALESQDAIKDFDLVGFTLQTELNFSNILNMLDLAGIPILAKERTSPFPLIHAGGPCAYNPEPMADFMDFFVIGEGEEVNPEIVGVVRRFKAEGGADKTELLRRLAKVEGVYVPSFYDVTYGEDGAIASFAPNDPAAPATVTKRLIKDLDSVYYPESVVIPFADVVHDRVMLEVFRGCIRGCRFCQAGTIYRPVREKSPAVLDRCAAAQIAATGYDEISLTSLSTSDYTGLMPLTDKMLAWCDPAMVSLSLPSLRVDNFSMELMDRVQRVRKGGLTFAAEAGTQRMRDVINKQVTEEELRRTCTIAFAGGWTGIKLYFMIGLPYEEDADVAGIADLAQMVVDAYYGCPEHPKGKAVRVTISVATFIPKPFTPFQWAPQDGGTRVGEKIALIKKSIHTGKIVFHYHDPKTSHFEAVLARGDRRLCPVILEAWRTGAKFDGWDRYFNYDLWMAAFKKCGIDPDWYALRARPYDEILPWDFIDCGVTKEHLIRESEKAKEAAKTPSCRERCAGCGADRLTGGVCHARG